MTTITMLALLALSARLLKRYGVSALMHPGFWFSGAWLSAFACYFALEAVGGVPLPDPVLLDNLCEFVTFAAAVFLVLSLFSHRRVVDLPPGNARRVVPKALVFFASAGFLGALTNWAALGAPLGYNDALRQQWLSGIPVITARMWYLYLLAFPASIAAGRSAATWLLFGQQITTGQKFVLAIPFAAGFFWSLATGGRQAFGFIVLYYIAGAVLAIVKNARAGHVIGAKRILKGFGMVAAFLLILAMFVGLTGQSRAEQQGGDAASEFEEYWYLAPIGQFITYNGLAIVTHQAYGEPVRRDLRDTGPVTLAGLQSFGLRLITGWRAPTVEDTNPERALESKGFLLATATRNLFYDLQGDFGYEGAFVAAGILVFISHLLFVFSGRLSSGRLLPVAPLIMAMFFWGYSHQFSLLMFNTFAWLTLACLLWDIANGMFRTRRRPVVAPLFFLR